VTTWRVRIALAAAFGDGPLIRVCVSGHASSIDGGMANVGCRGIATLSLAQEFDTE